MLQCFFGHSLKLKEVIKGRPFIDWKTGKIIGRDPCIKKFVCVSCGKVHFQGLEGDLKRRKEYFEKSTALLKGGVI